MAKAIFANKQFKATPSKYSSKLIEVVFTKEVIATFLKKVEQYPVQALEYKSFLRFRVAEILNKLCNNELQNFLQKSNC